MRNRYLVSIKMNNDDYVLLFEQLFDGIQEMGISEFSDPSLGEAIERDLRETNQLNTPMYLLQMLEMIDRYLAVSARETYRDALSTINTYLPDSSVSRAIVKPDGEALQPLTFESFPDQQDVRNQLASLIYQIKIDLGLATQPSVGPGPVVGPGRTPGEGSGPGFDPNT